VQYQDLDTPTLPLSPVIRPPPPLATLDFPLGWLLDHAALPIKYRSLVDVAKLGADAGNGVANLPYTFDRALALAMMQGADGVWHRAMLTLPPQRGGEFDQVGTVHAVRRLLEYGWDKDSPPIFHARRVLFRLLAEDSDPALLFEFGPAASRRPDAEHLAALRQTLREAAGAALAQAGFEADPRLRGAARRTLDRIVAFLRSPLAEKPWVRVGNRQVLSSEAFPPSIYALQMLAHMPLFRSEHYEGMELLYRWLTRDLPRQEQVQIVGRKMVAVPLFVLGDRLPHRNAVDADVPAAIGWLEMMARFGFLRRNENWMKLYERLLDDRGPDGVWHPHKGMSMPRSSHGWVWSAYPLEPSHAGNERWTDVTFRLGLIARLSGRPVEIK
jgi:hypothetical protein